MTLEQFFERKKKNGWLQIPFGAIYIRMRKRHFFETSAFETCLDIVNIEIEEAQRGRGIFTEFIKYLLEFPPHAQYIYVENVHAERFQRWFVKHGWSTDFSRPLESRCFFKIWSK